jgi:hypothetical protein
MGFARELGLYSVEHTHHVRTFLYSWRRKRFFMEAQSCDLLHSLELELTEGLT